MTLSQLQWLGSASWQDDLYRMIRKTVEAYAHGLLKHYSSIRLEGLKNAMQYINHDSISPGSASNSGSLEYKAGVLTTGL
jgi:hypothetical protein